ncbi:MAG: hypothetical protein U9Q81_14270 [Pseudomonadota bacterium]|nr:hypothetical protein [Pseudomonadota bacterium]
MIDRLSRAARPTLFDAVYEPGIFISLILANLMSPALWEFGAKVEKASDRESPQEGAKSGSELLMDELQRYANHHLFHAAPTDVLQIWGILDLQEERERLGAETVDYTVQLVVWDFERRKALGLLAENQDFLSVIASGRFPEYEYSTIDVIRAHRRHLNRKKHKPAGITSCADEATLIASLACALRGVSFDDIVIFGSPVHYTTFFKHEGKAYWFNGKKEYFDQDAWRTLIGTERATSAREAIDARIVTLDRIITPRGHCLLNTEESTLGPESLARLFRDLREFFTVLPGKLASIPGERFRTARNRLEGLSSQPLDRADNAIEVRRQLRVLADRYPDSLLEGAFYCARDLEVRYPQAYLHAALRGHKARKAADEVECLEDAIGLVQRIEGTESIFADRNRIALPDEVLLFRTGNDRERALLLYTLLQHARGVQSATEQDAELIFTDTDSFVRCGSTLVSTKSLSKTVEIQGDVVLRMAV